MAREGRGLPHCKPAEVDKESAMTHFFSARPKQLFIAKNAQVNHLRLFFFLLKALLLFTCRA